MSISSNRIVKRFFIGGTMDQQAGTEGPNAGYATFDEAAGAASQWYTDNPAQNVTLHIFESYRILKES